LDCETQSGLRSIHFASGNCEINPGCFVGLACESQIAETDLTLQLSLEASSGPYRAY
jgi:hypothetical protein